VVATQSKRLLRTVSLFEQSVSSRDCRDWLKSQQSLRRDWLKSQKSVDYKSDFWKKKSLTIKVTFEKRNLFNDYKSDFNDYKSDFWKKKSQQSLEISTETVEISVSLFSLCTQKRPMCTQKRPTCWDFSQSLQSLFEETDWNLNSLFEEISTVSSKRDLKSQQSLRTETEETDWNLNSLSSVSVRRDWLKSQQSLLRFLETVEISFFKSHFYSHLTWQIEYRIGPWEILSVHKCGQKNFC